jgi:thymidylate synthase (FAD)
MNEYMSAKLVSYSKPASNELVEFSLLDMVAYCARVSNPENQMNMETSEKLVGYLIRNHHWSPLEMVHICIEIETTRDIARQILRHRSFSFQEFSQRYAVVDTNLGFEYRNARLQDLKNRQNSIDECDESTKEKWQEMQSRVIQSSRDAYQWAIENGIAKEQARVVLPEGNTKSRLYMSGTLRSWVHYLQLRCGNGTQKEHMEVARACADAISPIFPLIRDLLHL